MNTTFKPALVKCIYEGFCSGLKKGTIYPAIEGNDGFLIDIDGTCIVFGHHHFVRVDSPIIATAPQGLALAEHIMAMKDDAHFSDHPEWNEIVKEAEAFFAKATGKEGACK